MKHYIGPQRYSTQKASMGAQAKPIDTSFITNSMAAAASVKDHMDRFRDNEAREAAKRQRLEDKASEQNTKAMAQVESQEKAMAQVKSQEKPKPDYSYRDFYRKEIADYRQAERDIKQERADQKAWERALRNGSAFDPLGEPQPIWVDNDTMNSWDWSDE